MKDCSNFHSPGPAAENALSPKVLHVRVTTHVRLAVEREWNVIVLCKSLYPFLQQTD